MYYFIIRPSGTLFIYAPEFLIYARDSHKRTSAEEFASADFSIMFWTNLYAYIFFTWQIKIYLFCVYHFTCLITG